MPLMHCIADGKSGWKWGPTGHCYTGPDAKDKALAQANAIRASQEAAGKPVQ